VLSILFLPFAVLRCGASRGMSHVDDASSTGAECEGWDVVGSSFNADGGNSAGSGSVVWGCLIAGGDNSMVGESIVSIYLLTCAVLLCGISHVDEASTTDAECDGWDVGGGCSNAGGDNSLERGSVVSIFLLPCAASSCGISHDDEASTMGAECDGWGVVGGSLDVGGDSSLGGESVASTLFLPSTVLSCGISHAEEASSTGEECDGWDLIEGCSNADGDNSAGSGSDVGDCSNAGGDNSLGGGSLTRAVLCCGISHADDASNTGCSNAGSLVGGFIVFVFFLSRSLVAPFSSSSSSSSSASSLSLSSLSSSLSSSSPKKSSSSDHSNFVTPVVSSCGVSLDMVGRRIGV